MRERDGVVTVECRAATWAQELDLLQAELLERLNAALGEPRVGRLRFVVGEGSSRETHLMRDLQDFCDSAAVFRRTRPGILM